MPSVSVVVPTFNGGVWLRRCVNSIIAQMFTDWECVVVDDGGQEPLDWVEGVDPRVRLAVFPHGGVSVARNRGAALTTAPLLAFCDQDDEWHPAKLEKQLSAWRDGDHLQFTGFNWCGRDGSRLPARPEPDPTLPYLLAGGPMCTSSMLVTRVAFNAVGGFDPLYQLAQDLHFAAQVLRLYPDSGRYVDAKLVDFHLHDQQRSRDYYQVFRFREASLDMFALVAPEHADAIAAGRRANRRHKAAEAFEAARTASPGVAALHLARAVRWHPPVLLKLRRFRLRRITHRLRRRLGEGDL